LIDDDYFIDRVNPFEFIDIFGEGDSFGQVVLEGGVEQFVDQGGFARTRYACN
jgi:hypothetical protein